MDEQNGERSGERKMSSFVLSDIRDALNAIRPVIAKADEAFQKYHIEGGQIKVQNRTMRAGIPIMFEEDFIVPALDFDKITKTLRADPETLIGPKQIVFKAGKARVTLPRLTTTEEIKVEELDGDAVDLDETFMDNLKKLYPLIENADAPDFQNSIICIDGQMIATFRGQIIIAAEYEVFKEENIKCLIPADLVKFLINKKTCPDEMILTDTAIQFLWPDDSWVISSLVTGKVPQKLFTVLGTIGEAKWEATPEHHEAISDIIALGGTKVTFDKDGAWIEMEKGDFKTGVQFPLPESQKSMWNTKHLKIALDLGEKFDFTDYPKPGVFKGDGVRGLIAPMLG